MSITTRHVLGALALAIAVPACTTEELASEASELGLPGGGTSGNHFYFAAYQKAPYIYKGCPDPGPEPWRERATLLARRGMTALELELGTEVALEIRARDLARGVSVRPNARGVSIAVDESAIGSAPLGMSFVVTSGRCSYEVNAEIAYQ